MVIDTPERSRTPTLDPDLKKIDKVAERWAKDQRGGGAKLHPLELMRLLHDGAVLGGFAGDDWADDLIAFDKAFVQAPMGTKRVIQTWYQSGGSSEQKARRLGISRAQIYVDWKNALRYFRGWLLACGFDV